MVYIFNMPSKNRKRENQQRKAQNSRKRLYKKITGIPIEEKNPVLVAQLNYYHSFFSMLEAIPQRPVPK